MRERAALVGACGRAGGADMLKNPARIAEQAMKIVTALAEERVRTAAQEHCEAAKGRAPVATGALRESISMKEDGLGAVVYTNCPYAAAVELGTSRRAPRPFMRG